MACLTPQDLPLPLPSTRTAPPKRRSAPSSVTQLTAAFSNMTLPQTSAPTSNPDITKHLASRKQHELHQQLRVYPWSISCLNLLHHRHHIFPHIFAASPCGTTKSVEYLVELRFLTQTLQGWIEVAYGRSPNYLTLSPMDRTFVLLSIANAYKQLESVAEELEELAEKSYSKAVKGYCEEVGKKMKEIYQSQGARQLYEGIVRLSASSQPPEVRGQNQ